MKQALATWSVVILSLCGILALANESATTPTIENVRLGAHASGHTRLVLDLDERPRFATRAVAADDRRAVVVAIEGSRFELGGRPLPGETGLIAGVGPTAEGLRVDLAKTALPSRAFIIDPSEKVAHYRLVVDFEPASAEAFAEAVAADVETAPVVEQPRAEVEAPDTPAPDVRTVDAVPPPSLKPRRTTRTAEATMAPTTEPAPATTEPRGRHVIVLDPGHGGKDPGALGEGGLREKAVTWATARLLTRILEERGYEVHLTREGDEYIDLPDRIRIARERNADMFISLHADANPVAEVRGASVYTLSKERSDRMARDAAASGDFRLFDHELSREDQEISSILYDLASTDTKNQSARLASSLVDEMKGRVRLVNNSHREAGLVVLLSPDVPAVLIELAFMSNASDRANLGSPTWRKTAATAIADGIDRYFELVDNRRASYAE